MRPASVIPGLLALILSFLTVIVSAQSSHQIFDHITTDHGLSSNKVESILQDKTGFYWIATQNGLNRFDGTNFKIFLHNKNDSTSLTHNYCTALQEDKWGNIWVATYKGVSVYLKDKGYFRQIYFEHPSKNFEITNRIHNLVTDNEGNMWISGNGLWKYDFTADTIFYIEPVKTVNTPAFHLITQLVYDPDLNGLWFTSGYELFHYSISSQTYYHKSHNPDRWKIFDHSDHLELAIDNKNLVWFRDRSEQVLANFNSNQNKITLTNKKILHGVKKITADDHNRIWILYFLAAAEIYDPVTRKTETEFFSPHHERSSISKQGTCLFIDRQKNHWIGSGNGIRIYNHANQYYQLHQLTINEEAGEEPIKIKSIAQTQRGSLWITTNRGLFSYDLTTGKSKLVFKDPFVSSITTICADGEKLWMGLYDQLICFDTKNNSIIVNLTLKPGIFFIRTGVDNDLWIGFWIGGLCRLNKSTLESECFLVDKDVPRTIKHNSLIT